MPGEARSGRALQETGRLNARDKPRSEGASRARPDSPQNVSSCSATSPAQLTSLHTTKAQISLPSRLAAGLGCRSQALINGPCSAMVDISPTAAHQASAPAASLTSSSTHQPHNSLTRLKSQSAHAAHLSPSDRSRYQIPCKACVRPCPRITIPLSESTCQPDNRLQLPA